jgi:hypothetical protein
MLCRKQDRMTLIVSFATLTFVVGSPLAFAQDKPEGKKRSGGAAMSAPTPPAELAKLNSMVGNWKCSSKMHLPPEMGGEQTGTSTMTIKKDMGGYWVVGQWKMAKTKTMPEMKGNIYWGYDPAEKNFVELGVDSTGGYMRGTSDGPQGGTWVWNEDGMMMGKKMKSRTTVTQKTPDTTQVKTEMEAEPGKWVPMGEDDCKKQPGGRA